MRHVITGTYRRATAIGALLIAFGGLALAAADRSESIEPRTVYYSTLAQCQAGMRAYQSSWTKISKSCTYGGGWFLGWKTSSGPYFFVYTTV